MSCNLMKASRSASSLFLFFGGSLSAQGLPTGSSSSMVRRTSVKKYSVYMHLYYHLASRSDHARSSHVFSDSSYFSNTLAYPNTLMINSAYGSSSKCSLRSLVIWIFRPAFFIKFIAEKSFESLSRKFMVHRVFLPFIV